MDDRLSDRFGRAAIELTSALDSIQDLLQRPGLTLQERRDLAQQADGLVGDLAASHLLAGDLEKGLRLVEGNRIWLAAPGELGHVPPEPPVAVAWVVPSSWETVVVTTTDHRAPDQLTGHVVAKARAQIATAVAAALNAARGGTPPAARQQTVDALCELTGEIAATFPAAERLLVVPLGICALLPYAAAKASDSTFLIDHTTITVAPSLSWAQAAYRSRPGGPSIGAFHPGKQSDRRLDLLDDRKAFEQLVSGHVLDQPTAEQVLAHFKPGTDIGHISCHGAYNVLKPLDSWLDLETELTIQAVLDHRTAPWLVNLSACETAIPDLQATEQQISFPTGFLLGGAAHVLATLWPVDNTYATAVNRSFYQHLAAGGRPAEALRHAIHDVRGTAEHPLLVGSARRPVPASQQPLPLPADHPYWWAPFTHHGSPW